MRRFIMTAGLALAGASMLGAQTPQAKVSKESDPTNKVAAGTLPAGWQVRLDDKDQTRYTAADTRFVAMGNGYHVTSGPAALYYSSTSTAPAENYTVTATLTQTKAPMHPEAYGVFVSGKDLADSEKQSYAYFLVRGTGEYMVNHRAGKDIHKIIPWTPSPAVNKADANGQATNTLQVKLMADSVRFLVNGTQVGAVARDHYGSGAGFAGLRVNHNLDVHVAKFEITK